MNTVRFNLLFKICLAAVTTTASAQTLFVPGALGSSNSSGKVGVGTASPNQELSINGNLSLGSTDSFIMMGFSAYTGGGGYISLQATGSYGRDFNIRNYSNASGWKTNLFVAGESGNVGIGTITPSRKLHIVAGTNQSIGTYIPASASGINDFNTGGVGWSFARPDDGGLTQAIYSYNSMGGAKNNLAISSRSDIVFTAGNSDPSGAPERVRISETGSVGIGTASPVTTLQVVGAITAGVNAGSTAGVDYVYGQYGNGKTFVLGSQYSSAASFMAYGVKAQPGATGYLSSMGVAAGRSVFEANMGFLSFYTGGTQTSTDGGPVVIAERMRIDSAGNVGIGTTNPTQKLSVNGTVRAKEVIVDTGWSDFVFDESYKLKALSETEVFIKAEKHLPGIPSATDVAEHGISLGDMQAKLLAKIEELTLHMISLQKENQNLRQRLDRVEAVTITK